MSSDRNSQPDFWKMARGFLHGYMTKIRRQSPKSVEAYKAALEAYVNYLVIEQHLSRKSLSFNDFNREMLKAYVVWMCDTKYYAPKTVNLRMTAIKSFLRYSADEDITLMNVYKEAATIKGIKEKKKPIDFMSRSATTALLDAIKPDSDKGRRNRMILILMYDSAARVQEIVDLTTGDLHIEDKLAYVTLTGKGNKTRNVPLMQKTILHLKQYLKEFHGSGMEAPLFYSKRDGKPHHLSPDSISIILKNAAISAKSTCTDIPSGIHCHLLRKTRAMDLYQEGVSLPIIMQMLGHENISTTSGFYAFATLEMMQAEIAKLNENESASDAAKWKDISYSDILYSLG